MTSLSLFQKHQKFTLVDNIDINGIPWIQMLHFILNRNLKFLPNCRIFTADDTFFQKCESETTLEVNM